MSALLIGAAIQVASALAGGIASAIAKRKAQQAQEAQKRQNEAWYDRNYNADPTQRASAQAALAKMRELMQERSRAAAGQAAVMGAGGEVAAQEKKAQNSALADAVSNVAAAGDARKDAIENRYLDTMLGLDNAKVAQQLQRSQNIATAASEAGKVAAGIAASGLEKEYIKDPAKKTAEALKKDYLKNNPVKDVQDTGYAIS